MFNDQAHQKHFRELCPGKLLTDAEWSSTVFMLACDAELRRKCLSYVNPKRREIEWLKLMDHDFSSGHRAALYWAFSLWSGNSWRYDSDGNSITPVDTMDWSYYMDGYLRKVAVRALELRWKMRAFSVLEEKW